MYNIEITFANGASHKLSIDRAKMADIDEIFGAWNGVEEIKVLEALNEPKLTVEGVTRLLRMNGWKDTKVVCPDGTRATISPCGYGDIHSVRDCDYFLLYWDMPWGGESSIEKLVDKLNRHAELKAEDEADKLKLRAYFDEHQANGWTDSSWEFYSDWHKDIYGYRPHGLVCGEYVRPW